MTPVTLFIDGVASWSSSWPDWAAARAVLRGEAPPALPPLARPAAMLLAGNERRRAPLAVAMALEVGAAAVAASGHDAAVMPSVFTSAHGDLAVTDALCTTLAQDPALLSPTRFHHSVHNAPSGYWALATGCHAASTALAAHEASFAAGLLEAALSVVEHAAPVLLVGCDTQASGALLSTNTSRGLLAVALVLVPRPGPASHWQLTLQVSGSGMPPGAAAAAPPSFPDGAAASPASLPIPAGDLAQNALADALPLCHALAAGRAAELSLPLAGDARVVIGLVPLETSPA